MADARTNLSPAPAFSTLGAIAAPDLKIMPVEDLTIIGITAFRQSAAEVSERLTALVGVAPPDRPLRRVSGPLVLQWAGPAAWWLMASGGNSARIGLDVRTRLDGLAAVADQSDARAALHISGPRARDVLAKGVPIDLHPRAFAVGHVAITHAAHIGITIALLDAAPTFEITLFRSYADSFGEFLQESAGEFVAGDHRR